MKYTWPYGVKRASLARVSHWVGGNVIRKWGLDSTALAAVAERIVAPTYGELTVPIDAIPEKVGIFSFRQVGAWG